MILRKHQLDAVLAGEICLKKHGVVYLALECRTGKTMTALELARRVAGEKKILFVTPKAAIPSILADSEAMGGFCDRLVVLNPESLHKANLKGIEIGCIVGDESHRLSGFPKPGRACKLLRGMAGSAKCILMSGTPSVESGAQLFHQFWWTHRGPWKAYGRFYDWHRDWGVPKTLKIAGGREVKDYSEVREVVLEHVKNFVVSLTQEDAGFKFAPEIVEHRVQNEGGLGSWSKKFGRDGVCEVDGHVVLGETPAAVLQKRHMAEGGTLIDENGEAFVHDMDPDYKIRYMIKKMVVGTEYAIMTCYIEERTFIVNRLKEVGHRVVTSLDDFVPGCGAVFVGSGISNAEGVDLAWMTGTMILYSLNWSGAKFLQVLERQNNFKRDRPIKVHVLLCEGGVDEMVFAAVKNKQNFNATFLKKYRGMD